MRPDAKTAAFIGAATVFALAVPRVGEPDRSEARAISAIRAIVFGESRYASMNGGYYDTLECLAVPSCLPGVRGVTPFVAPNLATSRGYGGYRVEFHDGPKAELESDDRMSRSSMTHFAVVAVPLQPNTARHRAFCADERQLIYVTPAGLVPRVEDGRCLDTTDTLR
jgi:hypothetical protein